MANLSDKIALVTGASRGLGRALALQLGTAGVQVVATARTIGGLEELDDAIQSAGGPRPTLVPLDLGAGHDQIDQLSATLFARYGRLDIFVHAAAMLGTLAPLTHQDPLQFTRLLQVNVTAPFRLLRSLEPLLKAGATQNGRADILLVDCNLGDDSVAFWGPYRASKAALRTIAHTYAREMQGTAVQVHMPCPPPMATKLHATAFPGIPDNTLVQPQDVAAQMVAQLTKASAAA